MVAPNDPVAAAAAAAAAAAVANAFASSTSSSATSSATSSTSTSKTPAAEAAGFAPERQKVSRRKRRANRRNAKKSTGPRTPEGKERAARNSTTHGIFCRDLVMPGEDEEMFHLTRQSFLAALKPQDAVQLAMVDGAVSARWRLNRCQRAEFDLIAQRTARAVKRVEQRVETLKRNLRCEDFSAAAINVQCERNEVYRRYFQEWKDLSAALRDSRHPGRAIAALVQEADEQPLERLSKYEHRLEQSFHRCLRDLHALKKLAKAYADEPDGPFLGRFVLKADDDHDVAESAPAGRGVEQYGCGEQRPPSPLAGEGGGEGDARGVGAARSAESSNARGERDARSADSSSAHLRNRPGRLHTDPPHPDRKPLPQGEREQDADAQNEPTAEKSAATVGPAAGSGEHRGAQVDPAELAELDKVSDLLSRCRDAAMPAAADAEAYDP